MSYLLIRNQNIPDNTTSVVLTVSSGLTTQQTVPDKVQTRSIVDRFKFTWSAAFATKTITINYNSDRSGNGWCILGLHNSAYNLTVKAYNGGILRATGTVITQHNRTINGEQYTSYFGDWDADLYDTDKVVITFLDSSAGSGYLGHFYLGGFYDFEIKDKVQTNFKSISTKQRTLGGQIIGQLTGSYRVMKFTTGLITQSTMETQFSVINYYHGDVEPLVFVPSEDEFFMMYGVQVKPYSMTNVRKRSGTGTWYYQASFELEEEF